MNREHRSSPNPNKPAGAAHARHSYRSRHRSASHASAHEIDSADARPQQAIDHPLVPRGSTELVDTHQALQRVLDHVRDAGSFAYDSEFIGELTYHPKLCLLQIATTKSIALIDPLADLDLAPFWEVLADPSIEKIVHAGEQDVEPVARLTGTCAANIFDTQICAGFIGLAFPVSLSKLVLEITGAKLGKGLTFTHWDQRPLSAMQLRYAADDVRYLPAVRAAIGKRLEELGHARWAELECAELCDPKRYAFDADADFLRIRGAGSLSKAQLAVLRELMIWRNATARSADVPPRAFLRDEVLVALSRQPAKSLEKLSRVRGLPRPVVQEHGQAMIDATLRALANPLTSAAPVAPEPTPRERFRAESLWALVQGLCLSRSIDPAVVVSRQDVTELDRLLATGADLTSHILLKGWRREAIGEKLLAMLKSNEKLTLHWSDGLRRGN